MSSESAQASAGTATISDMVLLDSIVDVSARRLVLGVEVAAAKFLTGQRIDDGIREQEILESIAGKLRYTSQRPVLGIGFFRDQIDASKIIQRGLHRYWDEHPREFLGGHRLTAELRLELDIFDSQMLLALVHLEKLPPVGRSHTDSLFDRKLRTSATLRKFEKLRRDAAEIALRSLYEPAEAANRTHSPVGG